MTTHRKARAIALLAIVAGLLAATASVVRAELTASGNLFITFDGGIEPEALPRDEAAPITVWIAGQVRTLSGEKPPSLREITIGLNRDGHLETRGLPTCSKNQIDLASSAEALDICGDALVGTGTYRARTTFPEQSQSPTHGKLLAFNAKIGGRSVILGHVYGDDPAPAGDIIVFDISHPKGTFGTVLEGTLPESLTRWGYLKRISLRLHRNYTYRGRRAQLSLGAVPRAQGPRQGLVQVRLHLDDLRRRPHPVGQPDPHLQSERRFLRLGRHTPALAAALCALAGFAAAPAHAAPRWLAPTDLSAAGRDAEDPQVAVDPAGDAVAVWTRFDGAHTIVQAAVRQAGGSWVPSGNLSVAGRDAEEPDVGIDAAGNAIAVWRRHDGSKYIVQSATRPAGGAWQGPVDLSAAGETAKEPELAVDAAGDAVAIWTRFDGLDFIVQSAAKPAGGGWQGPLDLSAAGQDAEEPQVAIDSCGQCPRRLVPLRRQPVRGAERAEARRGVGETARRLRRRAERRRTAAGARPGRERGGRLVAVRRSQRHRPGRRRVRRRRRLGPARPTSPPRARTPKSRR